jgi:hypothetical protein
VQTKGLSQWKVLMTPLGIKPVTFQLVAQCLNQLHHCVPQCQWKEPQKAVAGKSYQKRSHYIVIRKTYWMKPKKKMYQHNFTESLPYVQGVLYFGKSSICIMNQPTIITNLWRIVRTLNTSQTTENVQCKCIYSINLSVTQWVSTLERALHSSSL